MKAVIQNAYGDPTVLTINNIPTPTPSENEVLIKINATAVTAASTFMRKGTPYFGRLFTGLKSPKVKTPGTDLAGTISAIGNKVTKFKVGDEVMAETSLQCGAYAEYICLQEDDLIIHKPKNISFIEATGIIDGASTALAFFTDQVKIGTGQKVLINGASGSIGTAAIQLAKYFGAEVTARCSTKNITLVKGLGADYTIDYTQEPLSKYNQRYDVIFDTVGKLSYSKTKSSLTTRGIFLTPVLQLSTLITILLICPFTKNKLKFAATGLRNKEDQMRDLKVIQRLLATNRLKTVIDKVFQFEQIQAAHKYVDTGRKKGNVILAINKNN